MTFWRRCLQCFGGVWHFGGACSVLEGCGILEGCLQCFEGMWHFGGRLKCFGGCGIFGGRLQCFGGGVACLEGACSVLEGVAFWRGACSVLEGHDILEEVLAVFW